MASKRKLSNDIDGFSVDVFAATFSGVTEIEMSDASYMAFDDELLVVAKVRVKMPRLKEARNGDITRVNVLGVKELALVRSEQLKQHLCETLGLEEPAPQLPLYEQTSISSSGETPSSENFEPEVGSPVEDFSPEDVFVAKQSDGPKVVRFNPNEMDSPKAPKFDGTGDSRASKEQGNRALASFLSET